MNKRFTMNTKLILKALAEQSDKLTNIEAAIAKLAKHDEKIITMLCKYDHFPDPKDGEVVKMKEYQKGCHGEGIKVTMNR
jgi:hypothetical protein